MQLLVLLEVLFVAQVSGWSPTASHRRSHITQRSAKPFKGDGLDHPRSEWQSHSDLCSSTRIEAGQVVTSMALCGSLLLTTVTAPLQLPSAAMAFDPSDYASATVQDAVQLVETAAKDSNALVRAYENIAEIITEGKGVGGEINFRGVQLDRGFVSDEDTAIYNPGLTLLTEGEKERLVSAIVASKKVASEWNADTEAGYAFLRERLDPLHTYELRGYLQIVPFYGAALYLVALAAQQLARDLFPVVYIACAVAVFAPVAVLIALGP
jgi:hypothetical protein